MSSSGKDDKGSRAPSDDFIRQVREILETASGPRPAKAPDPEIVAFLETLLQMARRGQLTELVGFARIGSGNQYFFLVEDLATIPARLQELSATLYCYPARPCPPPCPPHGPDAPGRAAG